MEGKPLQTPATPPPAYDSSPNDAPPQYPGTYQQQQGPYPVQQGQPNPYQQQQYGGPTQQVVVQQPVKLISRLGQNPQEWACPFCSANVVTSTKPVTGTMNWLVSGVLCLALPGITWLGCACIPFCIDSLKDVEHTCPNCNRIIGTFKRAS